MGTFFGVVFGIYFWSALLIAAPYFWWKRTNRSQSPIERRMRAAVMGLGWPYFLFQHLTGDASRETAEQERRAAASRIIGSPAQDRGTPVVPSPQVAPQPASGAASTSRIANPFDDL